MSKLQRIIIAAMVVTVVILPLEGYPFLSVTVIVPLVILAVCFVAFGKKKKAN